MIAKFIRYLIVFLVGILLGSIFTYTNMKEKPENIIIQHSIVVDKIESMGRLEVVKYNIQDIIEYKKMRQWLPNAKTAVLVNGEIIACVDLSKISDNNVVITGDSVAIYLPTPEICHVRVDHSRSKVYDMTYGLWESTTLVDEAYRHAEMELVKQAHKLEFGQKAKENAALVLTPMLNALGFKHVTIVYDDKMPINR